MFPVIHARPAKVAVFDLKAQGADQPQLCSQGHARAAHISRIAGDFGFVKNDVEHESLREKIRI
jgi:hypothetical protein